MSQDSAMSEATEPIVIEDDEAHEADYDDVIDATGKHGDAGVQSKRWMVTLWLHKMPQWKPANLDIRKEKIVYCAYGLERAPSTGREHWHVYLRFSVKKRRSSIIHMIGSNDIWTRTCRGNERECTDYCLSIGKHEKKSALRLSFGTIGEIDEREGKQGRRTDLEAIADQILAGTADDVIAREHPVDYIRYNRGFQALRDAVTPRPPKLRQLQVYFFHGPTGTGKSYRLLTAPEYQDKIYTVTPGQHPWDGYRGEAVLLMDEWDGKDWDINLMKRILDVHPLQLPARYKNGWAAWTTIFLCSNESPITAYSQTSEPHRDAFRRRIKDSCRLITLREDQGGPSLKDIIEDTPNPQF